MTPWHRLVFLIVVLISLSTQSLADRGGADCASVDASQSDNQHPCCDPDSDSNPHASSTLQCDHCVSCVGCGVISSIYSMPFATLSGQALANPASLFPLNPYYRLLRPPRG